MKKVLFVINTLGQGGAEVALMEMLRALGGRDFRLDVYVMLGQGELVDRLPEGVRLLNKDYDPTDVLSEAGKKRLSQRLLTMLPKRFALGKNIPYITGNYLDMQRRGAGLQPEKLLWRAVSDAAPDLEDEYDLAVAYIEGASSYYVADHVRAKHKVAFVHVDYVKAGYSRKLDKDTYAAFERIFCVSDDVLNSFAGMYPEYKDKLDLFYNLVDQDRIRQRAQEPGGFGDDYDGIRILTVGRLVKQKALEFSVDALKRLKDQGVKARWYVLGEGDERSFLEKYIAKAGLEEDFLLLGVTPNPFPFYQQCDIYAHCSRFEGRSVAIQEAQALGCAVIATDCSGNRSQITDGVDGLLVNLDPAAIAEAIKRLINAPGLGRAMGQTASKKHEDGQDLHKILTFLEEE